MRAAAALEIESLATLEHFDQVTEACAEACPALRAITEASPAADYRYRGVKIPRQTQRYSGRTAMRADISVHEPKQPTDEETPLAFTMEGSSGTQPGALLPFVWAPGWNSNQSLHKYQTEAGGPLAGGTAGVRLIEPDPEMNTGHASIIPRAFQPQSGQWTLLPLYRIFGSEETSALAPAVNELVPQPYISVNSRTATGLRVSAGDPITIESESETHTLIACIDDSIPEGCAGYAVGLPGAPWLGPDTQVVIKKAESSQSRGGNRV